MATLRALQNMKSEREGDHFPLMRVYIYFVERLTSVVQTFATATERQRERQLKFLTNYFQSPDIVELQSWKDDLLRTCLDIVECMADGSPYLHRVVISARLAQMKGLMDIGGSAPPIPSYLFPTTKSYLRMDMAKVCTSSFVITVFFF